MFYYWFIKVLEVESHLNTIMHFLILKEIELYILNLFIRKLIRMKEILFIRHGLLEGKFVDYTMLNFDDIEALLVKSVCPNIDATITKKKLRNVVFLKNYEVVISSTQNRSIQTANIIAQLYLKSPLLKTDLLNEVDFFKGIIAKKDVLGGMDNIRLTVLTNWYEGLHCEKFTDSVLRFRLLMKFLKSLPQKKIICVTHGWYMRIISLYQLKSNLNKVSLNDLLSVKPAKNFDLIKLRI
jgi:hypothetical protein